MGTPLDLYPTESASQYGITSPITLAGPKPIDIKQTEELEKVIKSYDSIETDEELEHRIEVLNRLNEMVKDWIIELSIAQDMSPDMAAGVGGKIFTFGSYRLGVHSRGSDIDALCIAPSNISRTDYFASFFEKLKNCPEVKELRKVEEAYVPVIRMNFEGIEIDLLFARLRQDQIPEKLDLKSDAILRHLDTKCVRSLNGCRVTDEIINVVPNVETFRLALRAIKLWAKRHGIYSNILGYLGGVSWAMMVARVCQLYPNAVASTIVQKFFFVYSQWKWPTPVVLKKQTNPNMNFPVWNPAYNPADRAHLMPIITPAYPQQNSTFNVSNATLNIMKKEFIDGLKVAEEIILERETWDLLFKKPVFFWKYKHFIMLLASSATKEEHLKWSGLLEAKIRRLVAILERNEYIDNVHVNPTIFKLRPDYFKLETSTGIYYDERPNSLWFIGITFGQLSNGSINLTQEIQKFTDEVMKQANTSNMYRESMKIEAKYVKRKNLSDYISADIISEDKKGFAGMPSDIENSATELLRRNGTTPPSNNNNIVRRVTQIVSSSGSNSSPEATPKSESSSRPEAPIRPATPPPKSPPKSDSNARQEPSPTKRSLEEDIPPAIPVKRRRLNGTVPRSILIEEDEIVEFIDLTEDEVSFVSSS